jgi:hypothetical protein
MYAVEGNMEFLALIIVLVLLYYVLKPSGSKTTAPPPVQQTEQLGNQNENAAAAIQSVIDACMDENEAATMLLSIVASADGKISRDELKVIANFCMKHGALIESQWLTSISRLNSGVNMRVAGDKNMDKHLAALKGRPVLYLAGLYGAVVALTIGRSTSNAGTKNTTQALEAMIEEAAAPPAPSA